MTEKKPMRTNLKMVKDKQRKTEAGVVARKNTGEGPFLLYDTLPGYPK